MRCWRIACRSRTSSDSTTDEQLVRWDGYAEYAPMDFMVFYGVGNHGGGPTITNLREIEKYQKKAAHTFAYSDPDRFSTMSAKTISTSCRYTRAICRTTQAAATVRTAA